MRSTIIHSLIAMIGLSSYYLPYAQSQQTSRNLAKQTVESFEKRPDLGVAYSQVARFKIASRKTSYRVGELISIDIAVMNIWDKPIYFRKLKYPSLSLATRGRNDRGAVLIHPYTTVLEGIVRESFEQIDPWRIQSESFYLLLGCDDTHRIAFFNARDRYERESIKSGEDAFFKGVFEQNLFVDWGEACLDIKDPGIYTVIAEHGNDTVIVDQHISRVKTAVGHITSNVLTLTITE